jgi:hypothetical protein
MQAPKRHRTWWFAAAGALALVVLAVVVGISISSRTATNSSVGRGSAGVVPTIAESLASPTAGASPIPAGASSTPTSGSTAHPVGSITPTQGGRQSTGSTPPATGGTPVAGTDSAESVVVCTSADFNHRKNVCTKADAEVSAGNGGQTVDGDVSFPDYMMGTISLLHKNGAGWQRLGEFSTKTYPDVVVIDSNTFISVQLANVFAYGGHRAMPACSSSWGIEVEDAQGLPLGDAMFVYKCR